MLPGQEADERWKRKNALAGSLLMLPGREPDEKWRRNKSALAADATRTRTR